MSSGEPSPNDAGEAPLAPQGSEGTPPGRKRGSAAAVAITIALLALLVWGLSPRQPKLTPAPLDPPSSACATSRAEFVPSNFTGVQRVSLEGLSPAVKNQVLLRLNLEPCSCGCRLSLAACLAGNPSCAVARSAAGAMVKGAAVSSSAAPPPPAGSPRPQP